MLPLNRAQSDSGGCGAEKRTEEAAARHSVLARRAHYKPSVSLLNHLLAGALSAAVRLSASVRLGHVRQSDE